MRKLNLLFFFLLFHLQLASLGQISVLIVHHQSSGLMTRAILVVLPNYFCLPLLMLYLNLHLLSFNVCTMASSSSNTCLNFGFYRDVLGVGGDVGQSKLSWGVSDGHW